jgi:HSP20 family molecular chaperone IbpA
MAFANLIVSSAEEQDEQPHRQGVSAFDEYEWYMARNRRLWRPPTDVYETDSHIVIKIEIAGMNEADFKISFVDRRLIVLGRRRDPVGKLIYHNMEIRYGEFLSEVWIGWALDQSAIEATYENGFLFVKLPKAKEQRVQIRVADEGQS